MKKKMKRLLALALSAVMLMSLSVTAFAEDDDEADIVNVIDSFERTVEQSGSKLSYGVVGYESEDGTTEYIDTYHVNSEDDITVTYDAVMDMTGMELTDSTFNTLISGLRTLIGDTGEKTDWEILQTYYFWIDDSTVIYLEFEMSDGVLLSQIANDNDKLSALRSQITLKSDMFEYRGEDGDLIIDTDDNTLTVRCYWDGDGAAAAMSEKDELDPYIYLYGVEMPITSDWGSTESTDEDGNTTTTANTSLRIEAVGSVYGEMFYEIGNTDTLTNIETILGLMSLNGTNVGDKEGVSIDGGDKKDVFILTTETVKTSVPGSEKYILKSETTTNDDGDSSTTTIEVSQDSVNAGDTVTFELKSNVPQDLITPDAQYLTWTYGETGEAECTGSYILTFHDTLDENFTIDAESFKVVIVISGGNEDGSDKTITLNTTQYTVVYSTSTNSDGDYIITDGCTFELSIDLVALYNDEVLTLNEIATAPSIIVTYSATLSSDATAGAYTNKSYVTYYYGTTEEDIVTVYVYGIKIYKYDSSSGTTDEDGNTVYSTLLEGAGFTLYRTATTDENGNTTYSDPVTVTTTDDNGNETSTEVFYTDENGYLVFDGLEAGIYYLKEVEVPNGYVASGSVYTITVGYDEDGDLDITVTYVEQSVLNTPIPNTGGMGTGTFVIVGLALILLAGTALVIRRRIA